MKYDFGNQLLIPLTRGKFATIDWDDRRLVADRNWVATKRPDGRFLAVSTTKASGKQVFMHRKIAGATERDDYVDHFDGNTLNNRRGNLRHATALLNAANKMVGRKGYHGVLPTSRGRFVAVFRKKRLGVFDRAETAALVYDIAARQKFGQFATFNFPQTGERSALTGDVVATDSPLPNLWKISPVKGATKFNVTEPSFSKISRPNAPLTPAEVRMVESIKRLTANLEMSPTLQEIGTDLGVSKVTVFETIRSLAAKGRLTYTKYRSRSIVLTGGGESCPVCGQCVPSKQSA